MDMGNIYHDALWHFAERIRRSSYTWYDLPEQTREAWIEESMNDAIAGCANVGAFDEAKNRYSAVAHERHDPAHGVGAHDPGAEGAFYAE